MFLLPLSLFAQGWEQRFDPEASFNDLIQTPDGGYAALTYLQYGTVNVFSIYRTDPNGDTLWVQDYPLTNIVYPEAIENFPGGGFVVVGRSTGGTNPSMGLYRIDAAGNLVRNGFVPLLFDKIPLEMEVTPDGDIYLGGYAYVNSDYFPWICKTDSLGNVYWQRQFSSSDEGRVTGISLLPNGNLATGAWRQNGGVYTSFHLAEYDGSGNQLWQQFHPFGVSSYAGAMDRTSNGGYIMVGNFNDPNFGPDNYLCAVRTDAVGDTIWTKKFPGVYTPSTMEVKANTWGGFTILASGFTQSGLQLQYLVDLDQNGNQNWFKWIQNHTHARAMVTTADSGIVIAGRHHTDTLTAGPYLARLDNQGNIYVNEISGKLYEDANGNCQYDAGETVFSNALLQLLGTNRWASTDNNGNYSFNVNPGNHQVLAWSPGVYWQQSCPASPLYQVVNFTSPYDSISGIDFGFEATASCPLMTVSVGSFPLRRCSTTVFTVDYCNMGSVAATSATVEITLDSTLTLNASSIPVQNQNGNTYTFNLGNVAVGACSSFTFNALVDCNSPIGLTHCVEANIFPDSLCLPVDPQWNGASVAVEGICETDSVRFTLRNIGTNSMSGPGGYVILEDNILRLNSTFQLNAGDSLEVAVPANGSTWVIQAQQVTGHPGQSTPMAFVEACGTNAQGGISTGFATQYSMDDLNPFTDIYCMENVASWDPNDKRAFPGGTGTDHNIYQTTNLEYMIRFQNTGNDTAFRVVIRDTMSNDFDLSTFQLMGASHANSFRVYGNRILEWTFDGIMLPDSNVNEPQSHGWVKFKVEREGNLPVGTRIDNDADIYFDYNPAVETDICFVTLGELIWGMVSVDPPVADREAIKVYPNPFRERVIFEAGQPVNGAWKVEVYDLSGRKVREESAWGGERIELMRGNLKSGLYLFRVSAGGSLLGSGKIIVN